MTILWGKVQLWNLILKWRSWGIDRLYNFNITLLNEGQNWYWKRQNMCSLESSPSYTASHYIVISHFGKTYWIFVPQMSLQNTYKILINYFMILVKPLTPLMPKSFVLFYYLKLSEFHTNYQWITPFSRNEYWSYYALQEAPHCSFKFLLARVLNMLFTSMFLILTLFSTRLSPPFSHQMKLTKINNIFFKAKLQIICFPWCIRPVFTFDIFVSGTTLLSMFSVIFTSRK